MWLWERERVAILMLVDEAYILVWVGRTKGQIFTTYHDMRAYFMILIRWTISYICKWCKSTGHIFVNIGVISRNMENLQKILSLWCFLYILENIDNFLMQVDFSHQKYSLFSPIWSLLNWGQIFGSEGKLCLKMASKHKFVRFPPLFGRTLVPNWVLHLGV